MDTTKEYIKMRLKARKWLFDGIPPNYNSDGGELIDPVWINKDVFVDIKGDYYVTSSVIGCQLERQDQLQEIMLSPANTLCSDILTMLRLFNVFVAVNSQLTSMEQMWLAFVMKEKHNKVWNGEGWIQSSEPQNNTHL